jgi:hypothetical protein
VRRVLVLLVAVAAMGGCAARERAPASAPARDQPAGSPPSEPKAADDGDYSREGPGAALAHVKGEIDLAERELATSAGDCATACHALASMERATVHLCALAATDDDHARCQEAKTKVLVARDRVRATCGSCPGGPSLDRTAPVGAGLGEP